MVKKNNKSRRSPAARNLPPLPAAKPAIKPAAKAKKPQSTSYQATRETVESLVIALVLAFLFRTFQAEAFVIPTGSMAPTLMGQHKDVYCDQCGQRFKVNASTEGENLELLRKRFAGRRENPAYLAQTVAGSCQNCRYPMPFRSDLPPSVPETAKGVADQNSSSGDRILVNKYLYSFVDPARWDVVVFRYPGDAKQNYIKRLVGLPGETLRLYQGDVYAKTDGADFQILRKPPSKVLAMRQLVHDTDHDPASLYTADWPLRWGPDDEASDCDIAAAIKGKVVEQRYRLGAADNQRTSWLRYTHTPAGDQPWRRVRERLANDQPLDGLFDESATEPEAQLITDFNSYNTEVLRDVVVDDRNRAADVQTPPDRKGLHWAGDLSVDVSLRIQQASGAVLLDLVEAGRHFNCEIDVATGEARLRVLAFETREPLLDIAKGPTPIRGAGRHEVRFANVDDQLLLWVDGSLVEFAGGASYDAEAVFGRPGGLSPKTADADPGDLSPVGVGARGVEIEIDRLAVYRDLYYIADSWDRRNSDNPSRGDNLVTDLPVNAGLAPLSAGTSEYYYVRALGERRPVWRVARDPELWPVFAERLDSVFPIDDDQFFVMGDNSPQSSDCRLWARGGGRTPGRPGGSYLERSLLTGKAVCVYWPHALVSIPTPKRGVRIPIIPNLGDIRLVR